MSCNDFMLLVSQAFCRFSISAVALVKKDFKIKVSFPEEYNGYEYIELVDYIDLDISSKQKIE